MRTERKQKDKVDELEIPSNHNVLILWPCFSVMVTPSQYPSFLSIPESSLKNLPFLPDSDSDLCSIEEKRCAPFAQDFYRSMSYALERKGVGLFDKLQFVSK